VTLRIASGVVGGQEKSPRESKLPEVFTIPF
jgi:hypothetical protein